LIEVYGFSIDSSIINIIWILIAIYSVSRALGLGLKGFIVVWTSLVNVYKFITIDQTTKIKRDDNDDDELD